MLFHTDKSQFVPNFKTVFYTAYTIIKLSSKSQEQVINSKISLEDSIKKHIAIEDITITYCKEITGPLEANDLIFDTNPNILIDDNVVKEFNNLYSKKIKRKNS